MPSERKGLRKIDETIGQGEYCPSDVLSFLIYLDYNLIHIENTIKAGRETEVSRPFGAATKERQPLRPAAAGMAQALSVLHHRNIRPRRRVRVVNGPGKLEIGVEKWHVDIDRVTAKTKAVDP